MQNTVATSSLWLGSICFALYVLLTLVSIWTALNSTNMPKKSFTASFTPDDASKVLDSVSKVLDSLGKLSPAVVSLSASILFYIIAAACSGIIQIGPPIPPPGH